MDQQLTSIIQKLIEKNGNNTLLFFSLILTSCIALTAIIIPFIQFIIEDKRKRNMIYFETRLNAYNKLLKTIADLQAVYFSNSDEPRNISPLIEAGFQAAIVSDEKTADSITRFCNIFQKTGIEFQETGFTSNNNFELFQKEKSTLFSILRAELNKYKPKDIISKKRM